MDGIPPAEVAYEEAHIQQTRVPALIAVCSTFTGVAIATLVLRLTSRKVGRTKLGLDDYLVIVATFCLLGLNITACLIGHFGVGRHLLAVSANPENFIRIGKAEVAFGEFYTWSMASGKLAILALMARIFTLNEYWFKVGVYFWATWVFLWWVASWFIGFLSCRPLSTSWGVPYQCQFSFTTTIASATFNIISDLGILILPQLRIWQLEMRKQKKIAISFIFLLGIFATAISIARIPLTKGANAGSVYDSTWTSVDGVIFTVIEPSVVLICANLPMMPILVSKISESTRNGSLSRLLGHARHGDKSSKSDLSS